MPDPYRISGVHVGIHQHLVQAFGCDPFLPEPDGSSGLLAGRNPQEVEKFVIGFLREIGYVAGQLTEESCRLLVHRLTSPSEPFIFIGDRPRVVK